MQQPGEKIEDVRVDTRLSIMKELGATCKWIVSTYDYLRCNPSISLNGFKDAKEGEIILVDSDPLDDGVPSIDLTGDDFT